MVELNLDYLTELGGGDNEFIVEMLQTYLDETGKDMLEMEKSLQSKDLKRVGFLAHRCKAAFRMLGLESMTNSAENLEQDVKSENASDTDFAPTVNALIADMKESFKQAQEWIEKLSD